MIGECSQQIETLALAEEAASSSCSCFNATMPLQQQQQSRRQRRRSRHSRRVAVPTIAMMSGLIALSQTTNAITPLTVDKTQHRHLDRDGTPVPGMINSKILMRSAPCTPNQHTFLFTLYTDAHSITDNSWELSHAPYGDSYETGNSGVYIDGESLGSGSVGYGAVATHTICADKATNLDAVRTSSSPETTSIGASSLIESCYDLNILDSMGDGLTAPHSAQGGLAGGFSLTVDNIVVAEHRGQACLSEDEDEWNKCAVNAGFEYCGVRVCTTNDPIGGRTTAATVSGLTGSQCSFTHPQCDTSSLLASSSSSFKVQIDTDSFGNELSWEARRSTKTDSTDIDMALQNDLILAGGKPVFAMESVQTTNNNNNGDNVILGQLGVGAPLGDNESYQSITCVPEDVSDDEVCFDFRAYDAYGDGLGCGDTGSISLTIQRGNDDDEDDDDYTEVHLTQRDEDMSINANINGETRKACVNKEKLSKWSYCAVRLCADGTIVGLEGNQCDFGLGDELIDDNFDGVDPLVGVTMVPPGEYEPEGYGEVLEEEEEEEMFGLEDITWNINSDNANNDIVEMDEAVDEDYETWAEYYEGLQPGFREDDINALSSPMPAFIGGDGVDKSDPKKFQGVKGPKPNKKRPGKKKNQIGGAAKLDDDADQQEDKKPVKYQGVKGPKQDANNKQGPNPSMIQAVSSPAVSQQEEGLEIKPFTVPLLATSYPKPLKYRNEGQISQVTGEFLTKYFAKNKAGNELGDRSVPSSFVLTCTKSRQRIGTELRWVIDCTGMAIFQQADPEESSLPRKNLLNKVLVDAFTGASEKKFLNIMYGLDDDGDMEEKKSNASAAQMKPHKGGGTSINIGKVVNYDQQKNNKKKKRAQKKKQVRQEKLTAKKKQMKLAAQQQGRLDNDNDTNNTGNLNVMGYVSGSQYMTQRDDDPDKGYIIAKNGDIITFIDDDQKGGGSRRGSRNRQDGRRRRRKKDDDDNNGDKRMLRRGGAGQ